MEYDIDDPPYVAPSITASDWWHATAEYRTVFRLTLPTQLFWLVVYLILFVVVAPKAFSHEIENGTGVVCDTKAQIEMFADLGSRVEAVAAINADAPHACAMIEVAYIRGQTIEQVTHEKIITDVVEILVIAFKARGQWIKLDAPAIQFTLFPVTEKGA